MLTGQVWAAELAESAALAAEVTEAAPVVAEERPKKLAMQVRERVWRRAAAEVLGIARCPCCRAELVARQGRTGPYFACRCPVKQTGTGTRH